jgi:hypothetical protein
MYAQLKCETLVSQQYQQVLGYPAVGAGKSKKEAKVPDQNKKEGWLYRYCIQTP